MKAIKKEKESYKVIDAMMAMSIIMGGLIFPILTFTLMYEDIGNKSLILLFIIIPYYLGLYKFRRTWGFN